METERQPKRRRITNHAHDVQPNIVGSSSIDSNAPVIADPPARVEEYWPSPKNVSTELRNIESPSSRRNSLRALNQLEEWMTSEHIEYSALVVENFHCYGGIARVLDFMEANMDNRECVVDTAKVIAESIFFRWNTIEQSRKTAIEMAKMLVRRKGIQLLLRANREHVIMDKISSDTKNIWLALGRTMNGEETRAMIGKSWKVSILRDATHCIRHLEDIKISNDKSNIWTSDVLQVVLYAAASTIKDASIGKEDLKRLDIVAFCLRIMNLHDGWNRNDTVVTYALGILVICTKQKMIVTKTEFEQFLPMLIYCMRNFGENVDIRSFVLILLETTCEKVHKERIESTGVLEAISALLKLEGLCEKTKEKVRGIMRKIIN